MINPQRGDVAVTVDGQARVLRLTLGALAALEHELDAGSLVEMVDRFEDGQFRSRDILLLLWAGLNGGGWAVELDAVAAAHIAGGPVAAAKAGARLLHCTFGGAAE